MIEAIFQQPNYIASKKMLDGIMARHEAIASNLANLETPNYKRIDLSGSFATELQRAMKSKTNTGLQSVQPRLEVDQSAIAQRGDGNTTLLETELAALQKNSLEHTLTLKLITGSLLKMRLAITGRRT